MLRQRFFVSASLRALAFGAVLGALPVAAWAQNLPSPFAQAVAAAAAEDEAISAFYAARDYAPLWTDAAGAARLGPLLQAFAKAPAHGLPAARYDGAALTEQLAAAETEGDRARLEVALTRAYLTYARDMSSGALEPATVDKGIVREIVRPDPAALLQAVEGGDFAAYLRDLAPKSLAYAQLLRAKFETEALIARGGWGAVVPSGSLSQGDEGAGVIALRNRLQAMGYLGRSSTAVYDRAIAAAVQRFQMDVGILADGAANAATIDALNTSPEARLKSIIVALERMRWMGNAPLGTRHVWVNQPDFTAKIVDHGKVTFETRSVIGKAVPSQESPEFSDMMEHMVINPSWGVPRSIIVNEYLPLLQANPNAVGHLQVVDGAGRVVPRGAVNFAAYSARSFPFGLRQPPSDGNALGKVKFMFPNPHNIYLHDTPAKNLFAHEVRAYSHGCIRLADPVDFAYTLLAPQVDDPKAEFARHLDTGAETIVPLDTPIPVHLVYFTAYPGARGQMTYRNDIYDRDAKLFQALEEAGVVIPALQG